jgi:hypothetical protein
MMDHGTHGSSSRRQTQTSTNPAMKSTSTLSSLHHPIYSMHTTSSSSHLSPYFNSNERQSPHLSVQNRTSSHEKDTERHRRPNSQSTASIPQHPLLSPLESSTFTAGHLSGKMNPPTRGRPQYYRSEYPSSLLNQHATSRSPVDDIDDVVLMASPSLPDPNHNSSSTKSSISEYFDCYQSPSNGKTLRRPRSTSSISRSATAALSTPPPSISRGQRRVPDGHYSYHHNQESPSKRSSSRLRPPSQHSQTTTTSHGEDDSLTISTRRSETSSNYNNYQHHHHYTSYNTPPSSQPTRMRKNNSNSSTGHRSTGSTTTRSSDGGATVNTSHVRTSAWSTPTPTTTTPHHHTNNRNRPRALSSSPVQLPSPSSQSSSAATAAAPHLDIDYVKKHVHGTRRVIEGNVTGIRFPPFVSGCILRLLVSAKIVLLTQFFVRPFSC